MIKEKEDKIEEACSTRGRNEKFI